METKDIEKLVEHPLEDLLGIESGTTLTTQKVVVAPPVHVPDNYDAKDAEIDQQFEEIYNAAFGAFEDQLDNMDETEPKFRARAGEVAAAFLTTALQAANSKATLKTNLDKLDVSRQRISDGGNGAGGLVRANRNELLRMLDEEDGNDPIDGEFSEEK